MKKIFVIIIYERVKKDKLEEIKGEFAKKKYFQWQEYNELLAKYNKGFSCGVNWYDTICLRMKKSWVF